MLARLKSQFILFFILAFALCAEEKPSTVCLNMIVKNESRVIERCLGAVKDYIDHWIIVDTGSTDGTQNIIRQFMKDIPGELYERPWVDFGHNRNEAMQLAKGKADYILMIDADETLEFDPDFKKEHLTADWYQILSILDACNYYRVQMIKSDLDWKWVGVLHEYVYAPQAGAFGFLERVKNIVRYEGGRSSDPLKYHKDALVLEKAIEQDPSNSRNMFYLAQSHRDSQNYEAALRNYEKRATMGGWDEEVFYSMFQVACLQDLLHMDPETVVRSYCKAFHFRPGRIESLYYLGLHYRHRKKYLEGYVLLKECIRIPQSNDLLFLHQYITDYGALLLFSEFAYHLGYYKEAREACDILLARNLPPAVHEQIAQNMQILQQKASLQ